MQFLEVVSFDRAAITAPETAALVRGMVDWLPELAEPEDRRAWSDGVSRFVDGRAWFVQVGSWTSDERPALDLDLISVEAHGFILLRVTWLDEGLSGDVNIWTDRLMRLARASAASGGLLSTGRSDQLPEEAAAGVGMSSVDAQERIRGVGVSTLLTARHLAKVDSDRLTEFPGTRLMRVDADRQVLQLPSSEWKPQSEAWEFAKSVLAPVLPRQRSSQ